MSWVAAAIGGAAVVGYVATDQASSRAADAQNNAANISNNTQRAIYDQQRSDSAPWRSAGEAALSGMQNPDFQRNFSMSDFQADPGYAFRMSEGQKAIERSAAARGGLNSGATMKALDAYGQNQGSQEYQAAYDRFNNDRTTRYNRLASLAGVGQTANAGIAAAGTNAANSISANQTAMGNAASAQAIAQGNNISNLAGTGANTWMNYTMMNRFAPTTTPTSSYGAGGSGGAGYLGANTQFQTTI